MTRGYAITMRVIWFLLLLVVVGGCTNSPQSTLDVSGPVARMQRDVFMVTVVVCTGIFLATGGLLVYAVWRFRSRPGHTEATLSHLHGNPKLEGALIVLVGILLLIIAVPNLRVLFAASTPPADEEVLRIEAVGKQWWWKFTYPDLKVVTANELHIPVGRAVQLHLRSADVIHSFWVPKLAGKMDLIPNKDNSMWFKAEEPGLYYGQCAEFCGVSHANMRFRVVVHPQAAFDAWVSNQKQPASPPTASLAQQGFDLFQQKGCNACHAIAGTPAQADVGPDLTHFGSRQMLAAGLLTNTPSHLTRWLQHPQAVKPGSLMPNLGLNATETAALVAYLQSLK